MVSRQRRLAFWYLLSSLTLPAELDNTILPWAWWASLSASARRSAPRLPVMLRTNLVAQRVFFFLESVGALGALLAFALMPETRDVED